MSNQTRVRKAVFPVAGLGTRFLPATKASPKEMLPVVDKPLIQYAVEEAYEAGIRDMVFVTGRSKRPSKTISTPPTSSRTSWRMPASRPCWTWCAASARPT
jgi:CTP:molybdopterin cytidylyltransferase MocA